jgi:hypothetical protein
MQELLSILIPGFLITVTAAFLMWRFKIKPSTGADEWIEGYILGSLDDDCPPS